MRLVLIKVCAVAAVNVMADEAHAESPNVIIKPSRALQLNGDAKHLKTHWSTQDNAEERGNGILAESSSFVDGILARASEPDDVIMSEIKSGYFTDLFRHLYKDNVAEDDVYREMQTYRKDVLVTFRNAYRTYKKNLSKYPSHPLTLAEPTHSTPAEPFPRRPKDKGLAEVVVVQLASKVLDQHNQNVLWLQYGIHPTNVLKALQLDKVGNKLLEDMRIFEWDAYVISFNKKYGGKSITVFEALKEAGVEEKTMVDMVFSWNLRQESVTSRRNMNSYAPNMNKETLKGNLLLKQDIIRRKILGGLKQSWLNQGHSEMKVLDTLGLSPTLSTGFDFSRLVEWLEYTKICENNKTPRQNFSMKRVISFLTQNKYKLEQLENFLKHSNDMHSDLGKSFARYVTNMVAKKRKRDT